MTYYYNKKKSSLWRAAQINKGFLNNSCSEDEIFLHKIGETNVINYQTIIFDCRTQLNAVAHRAKGGGHETESNYQNCKVKFGYIDGIISLYSSYKSVMKL